MSLSLVGFRPTRFVFYNSVYLLMAVGLPAIVAAQKNIYQRISCDLQFDFKVLTWLFVAFDYYICISQML